MNLLLKTSVLAVALGGFSFVAANELPVATKKTAASHASGQQSQKRIDQIDLSTREASDEFLTNERMSDITEAYNEQIALLVSSQEKEIADLEAQILSIEETDQAVLPMLDRMVKTLVKFVDADTPFLPEERSERIARLEKLLLRADVSVAEKYRQILEAYSVEVQYGRTFEAYSGALQSEGGQQVTFLRLGRSALYYQALNGLQGALWEPASNNWLPLNDAQNLVLTKAIQVAEQQQVPTLLNLPLPKMER